MIQIIFFYRFDARRLSGLFWIIVGCLSAELLWRIVPSYLENQRVVSDQGEVDRLKFLTICMKALALWCVVSFVARRARMIEHRGKGMRATPAQELLDKDRRAPILLLRSFLDDMTSFAASPHLVELHALQSCQTFEEVIVDGLRKLGPVVAIGRPGEPLPPAGAGRMYVEDDRWQAEVERLSLASQRIAIILGGTGGIRWEIRRLFELGLAGKLLLIFPPGAEKERAIRWSVFTGAAEEVGYPELPRTVPTNATVVLLRGGQLQVVSGQGVALEKYSSALKQIFRDEIHCRKHAQLSRYFGQHTAIYILKIGDLVFLAFTVPLALAMVLLVSLMVLFLVVAIVGLPGVREHAPSREETMARLVQSRMEKDYRELLQHLNQPAPLIRQIDGERQVLLRDPTLSPQERESRLYSRAEQLRKDHALRFKQEQLKILLKSLTLPDVFLKHPPPKRGKQSED